MAWFGARGCFSVVWDDWECGSGEDWFLESRLFQLFFWRGLASSLSRHGFQWSLAGPSGTVGRAPWLLEAMALGWPEAWRRACHRAGNLCGVAGVERPCQGLGSDRHCRVLAGHAAPWPRTVTTNVTILLRALRADTATLTSRMFRGYSGAVSRTSDKLRMFRGRIEDVSRKFSPRPTV